MSTAVTAAPARHGPHRVLAQRDFRVFWIGALISNTGTWLQGAAVPYVLYKLTDSSVWVGLSVFASLFPGVVFGPLGGALADRVDRRRLLFAIQLASAVAAAAQAVTWAAGWHQPGLVLALTGLGGLCMGLGMPVWQGLVADLVPRSSLPDAVTMNSMQFHGSRAIGPAIAGTVIATAGPTWAFIGNAVSFAAVLIALVLVHPPALVPHARTQRFVAELRDGFAYARRHRTIAAALLLVTVIGALGNPIVQLAPAFSERIYKVGAGEYGFLTAAFGAGSAVGVYVYGSLTRTVRRSRLMLTALVMLGMAVLGFGASPNYAVGIVCVLVAGASAVGSSVLLLTTVQSSVEDDYRGRVLGAYGMAFTTSYPLGALAQGALADLIGARQNELLVGTALLALAALVSRPGGPLEALDPAR